MTCTKTGPKNDPFFNCRRKTKELSKKELSNVVPASVLVIDFNGKVQVGNVFCNQCFLTFGVLCVDS